MEIAGKEAPAKSCLISRYVLHSPYLIQKFFHEAQQTSEVRSLHFGFEAREKVSAIAHLTGCTFFFFSNKKLYCLHLVHSLTGVARQLKRCLLVGCEAQAEDQKTRECRKVSQGWTGKFSGPEFPRAIKSESLGLGFENLHF